MCVRERKISSRHPLNHKAEAKSLAQVDRAATFINQIDEMLNPEPYFPTSQPQQARGSIPCRTRGSSALRLLPPSVPPP